MSHPARCNWRRIGARAGAHMPGRVVLGVPAGMTAGRWLCGLLLDCFGEAVGKVEVLA